jgi:hypothetical protein
MRVEEKDINKQNYHIFKIKRGCARKRWKGQFFDGTDFISLTIQLVQVKEKVARYEHWFLYYRHENKQLRFCNLPKYIQHHVFAVS